MRHPLPVPGRVDGLGRRVGLIAILQHQHPLPSLWHAFARAPIADDVLSYFKSYRQTIHTASDCNCFIKDVHHSIITQVIDQVNTSVIHKSD